MHLALIEPNPFNYRSAVKLMSLEKDESTQGFVISIGNGTKSVFDQ